MSTLFQPTIRFHRMNLNCVWKSGKYPVSFSLDDSRVSPT